MNNLNLKSDFKILRDKIIEKHYLHLNPMQKQAVLTTEGPVLVLAGAGSGKTTVLVHRMAHILKFNSLYKSDIIPDDLSEHDITEMKEYLSCDFAIKEADLPTCVASLAQKHNVSPASVLALTFTNKAAKEMKDRVYMLIGDKARDMWVSTFHSSCVRILRRDIDKIGYNSDFAIYDDSDQLTVIKDCIKELNLNEKYFNPKDVRHQISKLKEDLKSSEDYEKETAGEFRKEQLSKIYSLYEEKMKKNNALDFDDLINKTLELFVLQPAILDYYRRKFRYILVDEYQDTNHSQYILVKLLSDFHGNICVVGDDDQSIYGWRGADVRNILEFENSFPNAKVIKLEENYRSYQNILNAANKVIQNNEARKEKKLWTKKKQGEKIFIYKAMTEREEAAFICKQIHELCANQKIKYGDCAILYRMNAQSRVIEESLIKYGIPYRVYGGVRYYDRKEIKDIIAYLRVIANPVDNVSLKRIINVPKRGIGNVTVEQLEMLASQKNDSLYSTILDLNDGSLSTSAFTKVHKFSQIISRFIAMSQVMPITTLIKTVLKDSGYKDELEKENTPESQTRLDNIYEFISAAAEFEEENKDASLVDFLENIALISDLDQLGEDQSALTLMTLHSAKGLEFSVVFLSGMEEGLFPHSRSMDSTDELEEERRLCYVGITRAKERLYISYAIQRTLHGSSIISTPSRFIGEIPDYLVEDISSYSKQKTSTSPFQKRATAVVNNTKGNRDFTLGEKVLHSRFGRVPLFPLKTAAVIKK
jgi:DNA helicase-2/ATP-dependent DNA helicase PcrA